MVFMVSGTHLRQTPSKPYLAQLGFYGFLSPPNMEGLKWPADPKNFKKMPSFPLRTCTWPNMVFIVSGTNLRQTPSKPYLAQLGFYGVPSPPNMEGLKVPSGPQNHPSNLSNSLSGNYLNHLAANKIQIEILTKSSRRLTHKSKILCLL